MLVPILVITLFSFDAGNDQAELDFAFSGFTLENWTNAFGVEAVNDSMITSLQLAAALDDRLDRDRHPDGDGAGPLPVLREAGDQPADHPADGDSRRS